MHDESGFAKNLLFLCFRFLRNDSFKYETFNFGNWLSCHSDVHQSRKQCFRLLTGWRAQTNTKRAKWKLFSIAFLLFSFYWNQSHHVTICFLYITGKKFSKCIGVCITKKASSTMSSSTITTNENKLQRSRGDRYMLFAFGSSIWIVTMCWPGIMARPSTRGSSVLLSSSVNKNIISIYSKCFKNVN